MFRWMAVPRAVYRWEGPSVAVCWDPRGWPASGGSADDGPWVRGAALVARAIRAAVPRCGLALGFRGLRGPGARARAAMSQRW